jgi:hypothetical protein
MNDADKLKIDTLEHERAEKDALIKSLELRISASQEEITQNQVLHPHLKEDVLYNSRAFHLVFA